MKKLKKSDLYISAILVVTFLILITTYLALNKKNNQERALKSQIEASKETIKRVIQENDSLDNVIFSHDAKVDSLYNVLASNQVEISKAKNEIERTKRAFANLTHYEKDSVINAFIRDNQ